MARRVSEEVDATTPIRLFHRLEGRDGAAARGLRRCPAAHARRPRDHAGGGAESTSTASISKTINCPADLSFEAFKDVYMQAYELGCKGCTTYRPERDHRRGAGSEGRQESGRAAAGTAAERRRRQPGRRDIYEAGGVVYMTQPLDRPEALPGQHLQGCAGRRASTPSTSRSTTSCRTGGGGRSRSSSTPRTWSTTPGPSASPA